MKLIDKASEYNKEYVHHEYSRIVPNWKSYEKVTRKNMINEIINEYNKPRVIADICTENELRYLERLINGEVIYHDYLIKDDKDEWVRNSLLKKFLIVEDFYDKCRISIPDELVNPVKSALNNDVNWDRRRNIDKLTELSVGLVKTMGYIEVDVLISLIQSIFNIPENALHSYFYGSYIFNFYVYVTYEYDEALNKYVDIAVADEYYPILDRLREERTKQGIAGSRPVDLKVFTTIFYNDFDINNGVIKEFLDEVNKLHFFSISFLNNVKNFAMLNIDREPLKESLKSVPSLRNTDLTKVLDLMDKAMDEMPSGALNGASPKETKVQKAKEASYKFKREINFVRQLNAHMTETDTKLFYKLYFGLLDYTNRLYKIESNYKIYQQEGLDSNKLQPIIRKLWEKPNNVIDKFIKNNPFDFSKEELNMVDKFKNGIHSAFIVSQYELNYSI